MYIAMLTEVERFLKTRTSPRTVEGYRSILQYLVEWLSIRGLSFVDLNPGLFTNFLNDRESWSAVSRYLAYNVTRSFLRWKFGEDHPLSKMRMKRPKSKPQPTITQDQFNSLLEFFNTGSTIGTRDLALFALIAETGLRASEVCGLKMRDMHPDSCSLIVLAKGGDWKLCKFSPLVASYLIAWLAWRDQIALPGTDTVFCGVRGVRRGLPTNRFGLLSRCREISRKVGFEFTPHVFRRFMATRLLELGAPQSAAMQQGGWKSESEFKKYIASYQLPDVTPYSPVMQFYKKK